MIEELIKIKRTESSLNKTRRLIEKALGMNKRFQAFWPKPLSPFH
tara:strand:+ start:864 stop:998 length:135 start_codon:yes stop_codon:yes gene_type:complete